MRAARYDKLKTMKHQLLILSLALALLASCKTLEERCAERFPQETTEVIREVVRTDTIILPDHWVEFVDTTDCPPSPEPTQVIKTIVKEIPGDTIYHEVVCMDTITIYQDQAKLNYLSSELKRTTEKWKEAQGKATARTWMFIASLIGCLLILVLLIRSRSKK